MPLPQNMDRFDYSMMLYGTPSQPEMVTPPAMPVDPSEEDPTSLLDRVPADLKASILAQLKKKQGKKAAAPAKPKAQAPAVPGAPEAPGEADPALLSEAAGNLTGPAPIAGQVPGTPLYKRNTPEPFQSIEQQLRSRLQETGKEQRALGDNEWEIVKNRLNAEQINAMKEQSAGLDRSLAMEKAINDIPPELDLTPFLALTDAQTGSKFTQSYKAPPGPRAAAEKLLAQNEEIQKNRNAFSKENVDLLRAQLQGWQQNALLRDLSDKFNGTNKPPGGGAQGDVFQREYRKAVGPVLNSLNEHKQVFQNIEAALGSGSYAQVTMYLAQLAKGVSGEKGVLTEGDISRVLPKNIGIDAAKLWTYINTAGPDTPIPPGYTRALRLIVERARENTGKMFQGKINDTDNIFRPDPHYNATTAGAHKAAKTAADAFAPQKPAEIPLAQRVLDAIMGKEKK